MLASEHFQDAIEPPSAFDIVVLILWSRLGTPLPEETAVREYRGIDGRAPVTGTEWEYEEALKSRGTRARPTCWCSAISVRRRSIPRDAEARARSNAQLDALDEFWPRHFADRGVFLAAYDEYRTLEEFRAAPRRVAAQADRAAHQIACVPAKRGAPIWLGDAVSRARSLRVRARADLLRARRCGDEGDRAACRQRALRRAFLLVSGASGSGKSSLVKAGIVPRLDEAAAHHGIAFLRRAVFRPGERGRRRYSSLGKSADARG